MNYILNNWEKLDERVRTETEKVEKQNKEKMDALREKYKNKDEDVNEETDVDKKENPFKPIEEVVKDLERKERTKNGLKEDGLKNKTNAKKETKDSSKEESKSKSKSKLTEKLNEVKKKASVVRQTKVSDKNIPTLEKQDSKQELKVDATAVDNKEKKDDEDANDENDSKKENDAKKKNDAKDDQLATVDENPNEISQMNTAATSSTDTLSNETVIEVKK